MSILSIPDANIPIIPSQAMICFAHLAPNAPAVDITLPDGMVLLYNVSYKEVRPYFSVDPRNYTLQVRLAGTNIVILTVPNVNVEPDNFYTVYALGESLNLKALLLLDGK